MKLKLGPIVGHTDHESTRVWIRVADPALLVGPRPIYSLRIRGVGSFPFVSTEGVAPDLGTAIAVATGLRPEWKYEYEVLRHGRVIEGAAGSVRTMPEPTSFADVLFVSISCDHATSPGIWPQLADYIARAQPRFLVMLGDQVYLDADHAEWKRNLKASSQKRRRALAEVYQRHWSREPLRTVLANIPTYMMWDDHDIRNGWGSWAPDSPTLALRYPRGAAIAARYNAYFEDARDLAWHFQLRNGPRPADELPPPPGTRRALPFAFQCGRLAVLIVDNRGARDVWRTESPVLGVEQWLAINKLVSDLSPQVDAFALVVPLPLTSMSPKGITQTLLGGRTDDIDLFAKGDEQALLDLPDSAEESLGALLEAAAGAVVGENLGRFKVGDLSDIRDNWAFSACQPEQHALVALADRARFANRNASTPRAVTFIGGDLHSGAIFDVTNPGTGLTATSLVTSGVAQQSASPGFPVGLVGTLVDRELDLGNGTRASLRIFTHVYNFGITHVVFGQPTPQIQSSVAYVDENSYSELG